MSLAPQAGRTTPDEPGDDSLDDDPFRIGVRYVPRTLPDGEVEYDEIPLTLEDLLFPEEGDHPVRNRSHIEDCYYLYGALKLKFSGVPGSLVLMDHRVHFDVPVLRPLGPDVAVFLGVDEEWKTATFEVAELAARAILVVEITSPDSRRYDVGIKKQFYQQAGVAYDVDADSRSQDGMRVDVKLLGFRRAPNGYEPVPLVDDGLLWLESLDLGFRVVDNKVMCADARDGRLIDPPVEMFQARVAAEQRAGVAEAQALAESIAREIAEEQARAESVARRAAETQARAEAVARRAAEDRVRIAEAQVQAGAEARLAVEARLAALEAEVRRLQGRS